MTSIPSDNNLLLIILGIHIASGLTCVISGLVAMLSNKVKKVHPAAGRIYYWGMVFVFITVILILIMKPPINIPILILDFFTFLFTYLGKRLARLNNPSRTRLHIICMGLSYILLLTGFYVDDGKNLPFWNQFSQLFFWLFPSVIGIPIILYTLLRYPNSGGRTSAKTDVAKHGAIVKKC